jgi:hypothetical protein
LQDGVRASIGAHGDLAGRKGRGKGRGGTAVGTTCGLGPAAPLSVEVLPCSVRSVRCAARLLYARRREGGRRKEKKSNGRKEKKRKK